MASFEQWVDCSTGKYPVRIGFDLLGEKSAFADCLSDKPVFIITHASLSDHLAQLLKTCQTLGVEHAHYFVASGEQYKTLATVSKIWKVLLENHYHRDATILALGGGMIGDIAAFCAACYLRGIALIHCPTTLLAQIDAAIGGKAAINYAGNKNAIGAFYPPRAVIADLSTLKTLAQREYVCGLAELIKYGLAFDGALFSWLETNMPALLAREPATLLKAVKWALSIKAQVVAQDEKEQNIRKLLNFGHTTAHALEMIDRKWWHGEAVAVGMMVATHLSYLQGTIEYSLIKRTQNLLKAAGLPTQLDVIKVTAILNKIKNDKKHLYQQPQWVLLADLGKAYLSQQITSAQISQVLVEYGAKSR